jgi:protein TonB
MDYGADARLSKNTITGIGLVVLLHMLLVYASISGLGTSIVHAIHPPMKVVMITEQAAPVKPPPPLEPLKFSDPQKIIVLPPHIDVQPTQQQQVTTTTETSPAPHTTVPGTVSNDVSVVCPGVTQMQNQLSDEFGRISEETGINSAKVVVQFNISASGQVSNMTIVSSSASQLNALALQGGALLNCHGQGQPVIVTAPFAFTSN